MNVEEIVSKVSAYRPETNLDLIRRAYSYAEAKHKNQLRDSGEPYMEHPAATAFLLADMQLGATSISAALLHDVLEDTDAKLEELRAEFGDEVAKLVDGVTKLSRMQFKDKREQQVESYRKMFVAMANDVRVVLIKLADRLHNMRTLKHTDREKQIRVAQETLDIYAPLAHRLGIWRWKWEFEDLALLFKDPDTYYSLAVQVAKGRAEREGIIEEAKKTLAALMQEAGITAEISGRPKHFYSIYQKMISQGRQLSEIWDLMGLRVIVDTVHECYSALGAIHTYWKPIPGKFKDYIAMPKTNMYQSLHTTVIGNGGEPLEIQIRTWDMHRTAEYGIAAHWKYKEHTTGKTDTFEEKMAWLRQMIEIQKEANDSSEFMDTLKMDLSSDEVYVFTPQGDVKVLPQGATPIDFAYHVHTNVGHKCAGAKVNSKLVPLSTQLNTGDIVEIITNKASQGPSRDWLKIAKSTRARSKIRAFMKEQSRKEKLELGKDMLEKELRRYELDVHSSMKEERLDEEARKSGYSGMDELLLSIGYGKISPTAVVGRLYPEKFPEPELKLKKASSIQAVSKGVVVSGLEGCLVRFAKCCSPVPEEPIVGFITRGRGVSVHRADCEEGKLITASEPERQVSVSWSKSMRGLYQVSIEIVGKDRSGFLNDVTKIIAEMEVALVSASAKAYKSGTAKVHVRMEIRDINYLNSIMTKMRKIQGVEEVTRI